MVKRKISIFLLALLAILIGLFFMTRENNARTDRQITLILDWYISADQGPILLAMTKGYFKKHNLDVTLIEPSNASDAPKFIAQRKADIAISYGGFYLHQLKQGLPVKQIGTLIGIPLDCLIYLSTSHIHSPKDLKGKRVGYSDPNDDFRLLKAVLKSGGLTLNDVTLINVQYTLLQSLMANKIDIATDMMRNLEPAVLESHGFSVNQFYPENFGIPTYSELIYIAHSGPTPQKITDFLLAIKEATKDLDQHPREAWESIIESYPKLNTPINQAIWKNTYPLFSKKPQQV